MPPVGGTLGTLIRTTLAQAGVVKEALERGAQEGKSRIDTLRRSRRRQEVLASLGEEVVDMIGRGDLPEIEESSVLRSHWDREDFLTRL